MSDKTTDVLVSVDGGTNWVNHPNVPGAPAAAIKRVRDTNPDLLANPDAIYSTLGTVTVYERQIVEQFEPKRWDLADLQAEKLKAATEAAEQADAIEEAGRG